MTNIEVTDDMVMAIVDSQVGDALDAADIHRMIKDKVCSTVDKAVREQVGSAIKEKLRGIAESEAGAFLDRQVIVNDGWGERKRYESFADFYVAELKKTLGMHEIDRTIKDVVSRKVQESVRGRADAIVNRICEEIIAESATQGGEAS